MTAQQILDRAGIRPKTALVLGSGLGALADAVEDACIIPTSDVDGYPASSVAGHKGRLVIGRLEGEPVLMIQGRAHLYEGHDAAAVSFPIRLAHELGARRLLVTNAAGGIHPNLSPGTLMFITDHINFVWAHPPVRAGVSSNGKGAAESPTATRDAEAVVRTRAHRSPYDERWIETAEQRALDLEIRTARGVYMWTRGPSYETKAEIAAFRRLGADAVGMSTVPEVLQAAALEMDVLGISSITNRAAGLSKAPLSHEDVLQVGQRVSGDLERLVRRLLRTSSESNT